MTHEEKIDLAGKILRDAINKRVDNRVYCIMNIEEDEDGKSPFLRICRFRDAKFNEINCKITLNKQDPVLLTIAHNLEVPIDEIMDALSVFNKIFG
jgi:hypothetical protein